MVADGIIEGYWGMELLRTWVITHKGAGRFEDKRILQKIEKGKVTSDFFFNVESIAGWRMNSEHVLLQSGVKLDFRQLCSSGWPIRDHLFPPRNIVYNRISSPSRSNQATFLSYLSTKEMIEEVRLQISRVQRMTIRGIKARRAGGGDLGEQQTIF